MVRKYRILHILPFIGIGGAEKVVMNLIRSYDKSKFEVAICSLFPKWDNFFTQEFIKMGVNIYYLNKHLGFDIRMIPRIWHIIRTFKPDVIHTHLSVLRYAMLPMIFCKIPGRIHTIHSIASKEIDFFGKFVNYFSFHFGRVLPVSISREVAKTVENMYYVKTPIIYNSTSIKQLSEYKENRLSLRRKLGIKDFDIAFLCAASFKAPKNHKLLIYSFKEALYRCANLKLLLAGDGTLRKDTEKIVKENNLTKNVQFLGFRSDITKLLMICDCLILTSDYEGSPMIILEAMAASKPVISTAVGGVPELIENGITGLLCPPKNIKALSNLILKISNNSNLRKKMGENARKRVEKYFDITQIIKQYEDLYLKILHT